jgi:hypothetical protein
MNHKKLLLLISPATVQQLFAQNRSDTVEKDAEPAYAKYDDEAITLPQKFEANHPNYINFARLHGHILYRTKLVYQG